MRTMHKIGMVAAAGAVLAFALGANANAADWQVTKSDSSVTFSASMQGNPFKGHFKEFSAEITFDPANPSAGHIVGTVKTGTVDSGGATRDSQLPGPGWFASDQYPDAHFESQSITQNANGGYVAQGQLTLKGTTNPATMNFTFTLDGSNRARFKGTFTINRIAYHVGDSVQDPNVASKNVDVVVSLDLTRQ